MTTFAICSIYDRVANLYGTPFSAINKQTAIRQFQAEQSHPTALGPMQTNSGDFRLFCLGHFDDNQGTIEMFQQPEFLVNGE